MRKFPALNLLVLTVFAYCFLVWPPGQVCSAAPQTSVWTIPFLGDMECPDGFEAVNLENWAKTTLDSVAAKSIDPNKTNDLKQGLNKKYEIPPFIKMYQLQYNDGKVYHLAWAFALHDEKGLYPNYAKFFEQSLTKEQSLQLKDCNDRIKTFIAIGQTELPKMGNFTLNVLELKTLERMKNTNEIIYAMSGRIILNANGLAGPLFAKIYFLEREGKSVMIALVTSDVDGKFWNDNGDKLLKSLHRSDSLATE